MAELVPTVERSKTLDLARARPRAGENRVRPVPDYTDDLRLAHVLADDADSLTTARFKALDLHVMSKPDLTPVTDADTGGRGEHPPHPVAGPLARRRHRRGARLHRPQPAPLGHRPDRRHQELRPRRPGLGHPDLAGGRRRGRCSASSSAPMLQRRWWASARQRRLHRPVAAQGDPLPGVRRTPPRGRLALLLLPPRLGRAGPARRLPVPLAALLAHPRVRRLLVLHAARRGCRRPRRRAGARSSTTWRPPTSIVREAGGRFSSLDGTDGPFGGNALASNGHLHEAALAFLGVAP